MPTRYKLALGLLYATVFSLIAAPKLGMVFLREAFAALGPYPTVAVISAWATTLAASVWLINKINRDWPTLMLPPEPIYSPMEAEQQVALVAVRPELRPAGLHAVQAPLPAETERAEQEA
jgi:hypothetical protein